MSSDELIGKHFIWYVLFWDLFVQDHSEDQYYKVFYEMRHLHENYQVHYDSSESFFFFTTDNELSCLLTVLVIMASDKDGTCYQTGIL